MSRTRRVLVVDDDDDIREMLDMVLSAEGYEVLSAADGAAALDTARQSPPDVILLDVKMQGMNGTEFARRYQEEPAPHAPIIAVTAAQDGGERAAQMEAAGYLAKPFTGGVLLEMVG